MSRWAAWLKKDGWILTALLFCIAMCLLLGSDTGNATEESRISKVLSNISGAGDVEVAVYYEDSVPCGAVVVAEGAGDIAVQLKLVSAVTTLLGIQQGRVAVYEKGDMK